MLNAAAQGENAATEEQEGPYPEFPSTALFVTVRFPNIRDGTSPRAAEQDEGLMEQTC